MRMIHINEPDHRVKFTKSKIEAILKVKPEAILFEYPTYKNKSLSNFNKFKPQNKPKKLIIKWNRYFKLHPSNNPYLKSQHKILKTIEKLWEEGDQIYLFEIDVPLELTRIGNKLNGIYGLVWDYLRERTMVKNIKDIKKKFNFKTMLIFCHNGHWKNIQFLMGDTNEKQIWKHYFTNNNIKMSKEEIKKELKKENKTLYKYWK